MSRKVGILGGTFDPPHLGHLIIANEALDQLGLDEIKFMPNQEPPHKKRNTGTSATDRLKMVELAIADHQKFSLEKIELERRGRSYTYDTIKELKERTPDADFYFIIGADMVEYLPNWYKIDELVKLVRFVGTNRPRFQLETPYPIQIVEVPKVDISSTLIRNRVKAGKSVKYLLPDSVIRYIEENRLYGS
ncbi:nicotinate-nucleotide adenylyltransferase [Siminovitchia sp. FSL H7-0308]|uniref:Probable nicotinate-nucleotide adenylyltransferase n=1 Tax=Siminovitchia thermophila TaxID=1245522 RepID=A0ABS2R9K9_9BACI|nr:nicotinate-nucleotide adenylyltransferase [Siminovitchia thermophila]MBM7716336.1 nicotinate-nucleotide adenylyltransferase [Siminovitchia thermophila]ONK24172.1 nicotinic acid mononucleotide adenylyltransferase [Bacillus sp. VT-16-64]